jgi:hypothetical protein
MFVAAKEMGMKARMAQADVKRIRVRIIEIASSLRSSR